MKTWSGAVLLVLGALLAAVPVVLGHLAEAAYREGLVQWIAEQPDWQLTQDGYQRGWFTSTAALALRQRSGPRPEVGTGLLIHLDGRIDHSPRVWFTPRFPPLIAEVHGHLAILGTALPLPDMLVRGDLQLDGVVSARVSAPAAALEPTSARLGVRHGALEGELRFLPMPDTGLTALLDRSRWPAGGALVFDLHAPEFDIQSLSGPLAAVTGARMEGTLQTLSDASELGRDQPSPLGEAGTALTQGQSVGAGGSRGPEGEVPNPGGQAKTGLLRFETRLSAQRLAAPGLDLGNVQAGLEVERLPLEVLAVARARLGRLRPSRVPSGALGLGWAGLLAEILPDLATAGTRLTLDPLSAETPDGPLRGRLDMGLIPMPAASSPASAGSSSASVRRLLWWSPSQWLTLFQADADLDLPEPVVLALLARSEGLLRLVAPRSVQGREGSAADPSQRRLDDLVNAGWITRQGGQLLTALRSGDGLITINGKTLAIP